MFKKRSSIVVKEETANENSLFSELSMQDLGDVDKGADIAGYYLLLNFPVTKKTHFFSLIYKHLC